MRSLAFDGETVATCPAEITVIGEKNEPIADAQVEIRTGTQDVTKASTDSQGRVEIPASSPATYEIHISKGGFLPAETKCERSDGRSSGDLEIVLSSAALSQQSINVTDQATNPVTESASIPKELPPDQAKTSSVHPATLKEALPLIAGIVRAKDGTVRIAGFGEDHSALLVNSVDVTDPATGGFGLSVPIDSVQNIQVSEMPYLAQYGKFTAGVVSAETRRGGDKWEYSLNDPFPDFRIRSGHMEGVADASPRFNLSGPLIAGKLYFVEGAEYLFNKPEVHTLPYPENLTTFKAFNSFTQLDFILSPKQTLTASYHFAPHSQQYAGLDYFNPQPVTPDADYRESTAALTHRWSLGEGLLTSTFAGTGISSEVTAQGNEQMLLTPVGNQGNYFNFNSRGATRFQWIEQWAPGAVSFHGQHFFQFGGVYAHSENEGQFVGNPVQVLNAYGALLQRIKFVGGKPYDLSDSEPALYAQDHWILNSRFAMDVGIRLEGQTITSTTRAAPRTGFVWSPGEAGKNAIRGGIGVFYDSVPLDVYAFNSFPDQIVTTYGAAGDPIERVHYFNVTDEAAHSKFPFIGRKQKAGNFAPYSTAWNLEYERVVSRWVTLRVKYLQSHEQDMITLQPETIQDRHAFLLGSSGWAQVRQAEFTTRVGSASMRQFYFSYVRQYAYGDINDAGSYLGLFPFPVVQNNLTASLPSEIPNRFLLWGTYGRLPKKITLGPHIEYRNGFPYYPTNVLQQTVPIAGPQPRYPKYFTLDMRISKDIQVKEHAVRLSVTGRNLTNHYNPLEVYSNTAAPQYGTFFGNYDRKFLFDFDFLF